MALDDTLAGGIVGVAAGLTIVRQYHQAVVLVPIHSPLGVQAVILYQCWIAIGIVGVMLMPYLRGSGGLRRIRKSARSCPPTYPSSFEVFRTIILVRFYFSFSIIRFFL